MLDKERQVTPNTLANAIHGVHGEGHRGTDRIVQLLHAEIDGCQKELFLAAEVAIQSSLAHLELIGKELGVGIGIAVEGKQIDGRGQNLFGRRLTVSWRETGVGLLGAGRAMAGLLRLGRFEMTPSAARGKGSDHFPNKGRIIRGPNGMRTDWSVLLSAAISPLSIHSMGYRVKCVICTALFPWAGQDDFQFGHRHKRLLLKRMTGPRTSDTWPLRADQIGGLEPPRNRRIGLSSPRCPNSSRRC